MNRFEKINAAIEDADLVRLEGRIRRRKQGIPSGVVAKVYARDGMRCRYCGDTKGPFHLDHVYPESRGGETSVNNLVVACASCNQVKHAKVGIWPMPIDYFGVLDEVGDLRHDAHKAGITRQLIREKSRYAATILLMAVLSILVIPINTWLPEHLANVIGYLWLPAIIGTGIYLSYRWPIGWEDDLIAGEGRWKKTEKRTQS